MRLQPERDDVGLNARQRLREGVLGCGQAEAECGRRAGKGDREPVRAAFEIGERLNIGAARIDVVDRLQRVANRGLGGLLLVEEYY